MPPKKTTATSGDAIKTVKHVKIASLVPHEKNPRRGNVTAIKNSLERFGQYAPIVVEKTTNRVLKGNHTLAAAKELGWTTINAAIVEYDDADQLGVLLADNRTSDLATYDETELESLLAELQEQEYDLSGTGYESDYVEKQADQQHSENHYTQKIEAPIYEPTQPTQPKPETLYDNTKTVELQKQVKEAELPANVQDFLLAAAHRFTRYDFQQIAEYYAHANPAEQQLIEELALVIIDFNKAIEKGFVKLDTRISNLFAEEYPDE